VLEVAMMKVDSHFDTRAVVQFLNRSGPVEDNA
jgi:hypothetical protein